jgi:hypothetical protein
MNPAFVPRLLADTIEPETSDGLTTAVVIGVILIAIAVAAGVLYLLHKRGRTDQE